MAVNLDIASTYYNVERSIQFQAQGYYLNPQPELLFFQELKKIYQFNESYTYEIYLCEQDLLFVLFW
jgi:hypothetical protein